MPIRVIGSAFLFAILSVAHAQTLQDITDNISKRNYAAAATQAHTIIDTGRSESSQAAILLLKAYSAAGDHLALEQHFDKATAAVAGDLAANAACYFERAKSSEKNAKDLNGATIQYNEIITRFPNDPFVTPGSYFQLAGISLRQGNLAEARKTYNQILTSFSASPFVDDAYAGLAKVESQSFNPNGIRALVQLLDEKFPASLALQQALLTQGDFAYQQSGDLSEASKAYRKLVGLNPHSMGAITARVRLADMTFETDFRAAITEYNSILSDNLKLSRGIKEWINCQLGLCYWQIKDISKARSYFLPLVEAKSTVSKAVHVTADMHIKAFDNPQSIYMLKALFDRGLRTRKTGQSRDFCWEDWLQVMHLATLPLYEAYCNDETIPLEQRASLRYHLALVYFEVGDHGKIDELADKVLAMNPTGISRQQALYIKAYHHGHCGNRLQDCIEIYRKILDERPDHKELVPAVYKEMVKVQERLNDPLGVMLTAEEFRVLYPYRKEVKDFEKVQRRTRLISKTSITSFDKEREKLLSKIKQVHPNPVLLSNNIEPNRNKSITLTMVGGKK